MPKTLQKPKNAQEQPLISQYYKNSETEKLYRTYLEEFSELTSDAIKFYFRSARKGINFFKAYLFEEIRRRDLRIGGLCQTRKLSIQDDDWEITGENEERVNFILDNYKRINIQQVISDIVEAQLQGMSVFQLFYDTSGPRWLLSDMQLIPNYLILTPPLTDGIGFLDFTRMSVYALRAEASSERPNLPRIEIAPENYFEVYSFDGNEENGLLNGLIDGIIWGYFFKSYGLKDFSIFLERFAMPGIVGKYDPLMSKPDRDKLWQAVQNFGNLYKAMIPNTAALETVSDNQKQSSGTLYENYVKYWNDELSIRILGQAMTTDTGQGGSFAKANVGNIVREDINAGDRALVRQAMNALNKKLIDLNFATTAPGDYPVFSFKKDEELEIKLQKADLLVKLKQSGFEADAEEMSEAFGFALTKTSSLSTSNGGEFSEDVSKKKSDGSNRRRLIEEYLLDLWSSVQ